MWQTAWLKGLGLGQPRDHLDHRQYKEMSFRATDRKPMTFRLQHAVAELKALPRSHGVSDAEVASFLAERRRCSSLHSAL
jgi:hypothetical protein